LGPYERELLHYAGILHDIGYHINYKKHHRHTYYLVKNGNLNGFEEKEVEIVANIALYHLKGSPKKSHENWARVPPQYRRVVRFLSGLLRLADGLDRSHFSVVKQIQVSWNRKKLILKVKAKGDPELEIWAAERKKELLEKVFDKEVVFMVSPSSSKAKKRVYA
jgi:exopolyphosphatase/guanosine-5'-triphosphate,3'-diphosphate pyrophosphatase